ncbi:sirohydrochlorin chelatase [Enterococcus sp. AZ103]|uniref:sirohydrochlorin chelatase n=1 Tax=Enterococcus sp. AZ103 TaxID=2774628 RepID=UPI003F25ADFE
MKGIIFVLHGRREKLSKTNFSIIEEVEAQLENPSAIGLLEGEEQTLEDAMEKMQTEKVEEIIFLPVLLFAATHVNEDLPTRAKKYFMDTPFSILPTLGTTAAVLNFVVEEISEKKEDSAVLLIAHGTPHYQEPYVQLSRIANAASLRSGRNIYPVSYIGEGNYQDFLINHPEEFIVLPLFLTSGFLLNKIKTKITKIHGDDDIWLPTLENQPALKAAIWERLKDAHVSSTN